MPVDCQSWTGTQEMESYQMRRALVGGFTLVGAAFVLSACSSGADSSAPVPRVSAPPVPTTADPPAAAPTALYVLGDSLSDVGNTAAAADFLLSLPIDPPTVGLCNPVDVLVVPRPCEDLFYRKSRVSDGPVAIEQLAAHFGLDNVEPSLHVLPDRPSVGTNYAVAGGTARGQGIADLSNQVDMLLLDHDLALSADALYAFVIGGNDAIDALRTILENAPDAASASASIVDDAVAAIGANAERILDAGARRLVVANVPNLASLPAIRAEALASGDEAAVLAAASTVSSAFNDALAGLLDDLGSGEQWQSPTALVLARFDLSAALEDAVGSIAADGGNALEACFDADVYRDSPTADRVFHPQCEPVADGAPRFAEFMFWDGIHPTGTAHAAIAAALVKLYPLP